MTNQITSNDFQVEVLSSSLPVVVDFFATWCGPCKAMSPIFDELAQEYKDKVKFVKIDVDQNQDLAGQYNIFSIPTFLIFKDGKVVNQLTGAVGKDGITNALKNI